MRFNKCGLLALLAWPVVGNPLNGGISLAEAQQAPPKGLAISWVGHSFHVYLPSPVGKLASEAGIQGHRNLGVDFIGASTPCQHWSRAGGDTGSTGVKQILRTGKADVQTLSTQQNPQEQCVGKFAKYAVSSTIVLQRCYNKHCTN